MSRSRTAPAGEDDVRVRVVPGPREMPEAGQPFETDAVTVPLRSMTASSPKAETAVTAARKVDEELAVAWAPVKLASMAWLHVSVRPCTVMLRPGWVEV